MAENLQRVPGIKMNKENLTRLAQIKQESAGLFGLAQRLMDLSKLGQPRLEFVYLNELLKKRLDLLRELVEAQHMNLIEVFSHELDRPTAGEGSPILVDPRQIEQVITNLGSEREFGKAMD
jgi:signal transduction histidine kinase